VRWLSDLTEISQVLILQWIGLARGKFYDWSKRYGRALKVSANAA